MELRLIGLRRDVIIDVVVVEMFDIGVDTSANTEIIVLSAGVTVFKFRVIEARALELCPEAMIGRVPGIGGEVTAISLGAVMSVSDFAALAPSEESFIRC